MVPRSPRYPPKVRGCSDRIREPGQRVQVQGWISFPRGPISEQGVGAVFGPYFPHGGLGRAARSPGASLSSAAGPAILASSWTRVSSRHSLVGPRQGAGPPDQSSVAPPLPASQRLRSFPNARVPRPLLAG